MLKHNYLFEDLSTVAPEPNPALDPTSSSGGMYFSLIYHEIVSPGLAGKNQGVNLQKYTVTVLYPHVYTGYIPFTTFMYRQLLISVRYSVC